MRLIATAALLVFAVSACTHAHAKASPESPALDVPSPPSHDVETTEIEAPPPIPLPQEPAHDAPARSRPAPAPPSRGDAPRSEAPKPEPAPAPPADAPKPDEAPPRPASPLQTMPTTAEGEVERGIRATVQRANSDLSRVDYRALNADARNQYDTAKGFIRQADDAIKAKNLLFAKNLAEKAAALAAQLASR